MLRRVFIASALLLTVALLGVSTVVYVTAPRHRITRENIAKIQHGMTLAEVEELLGASPGNHSRGMAQGLVLYTGEALWHAHHACDWVADDVSVRVRFDADWKVSHHALSDVIAIDDSWVGKLALWLRPRPK
jgi:hypothetical protein